VAISERAIALGEEFSDFILVDDSRGSIILNIPLTYFDTVYREYKRLGLTLRHVTRFKDKESMTCVFAKSLQA